jgi:endo-1,4-beta-xylanase
LHKSKRINLISIKLNELVMINKRNVLIMVISIILSSPIILAQPQQNPDIDGNGVVNILDVLQVVNDFDKTTGFNPRVDLNNDGVINILDILVIVNNWGFREICHLPPIEESSLKEYANIIDFRIGTPAEANLWHPNRATLGKEFTDMHFLGFMRDIWPEQTTFDFTRLEEIVDFAADNNQEVIGSAFVWIDLVTPGWLGFYDHSTKESRSECGLDRFTRDEIDGFMMQFVNTVITEGTKYGINIWEIVNEPIDDNGNVKTNSRCWASIFGEEYIKKAFTYAHEADPNAKLMINEYFGDIWGGQDGILKSKVDGYFELITRMKSQGAPIHIAGIQMHKRMDTLDEQQLLSDFAYFLDKAKTSGVEVLITEMDVYEGDLPNNADMEQHGQLYKDIAALCLQHYHCIGLYTWGVTDRFSWWRTTLNKPSAKPLMFGEVQTNGLFYERKPAYFGVADAISEKAEELCSAN